MLAQPLFNGPAGQARVIAAVGAAQDVDRSTRHESGSDAARSLVVRDAPRCGAPHDEGNGSAAQLDHSSRSWPCPEAARNEAPPCALRGARDGPIQSAIRWPALRPLGRASVIGTFFRHGATGALALFALALVALIAAGLAPFRPLDVGVGALLFYGSEYRHAPLRLPCAAGAFRVRAAVAASLALRPPRRARSARPAVPAAVVPRPQPCGSRPRWWRSRSGPRRPLRRCSASSRRSSIMNGRIMSPTRRSGR